MTDTQFQVGKTYRTERGDTVLLQPHKGPKTHPLSGLVLDGPDRGYVGCWTTTGAFIGPRGNPLDLLPGALPTPADAQDDKAELLAALREWWRLSLAISSAVRRDQPELSDDVTAVIHQTRAAIAKAERTS